MAMVVIERMNARHIAFVMEIERACFSTPWSEASIYNEIHNPQGLIYVAMADSSVVGYVSARQIVDEGHILNLAVRADMRRQGIGRALAMKVITELIENGSKYIYLEVRVSNHAAKMLYEGLGFRIVGTRKLYYDLPKEDAVIMMLKVDKPSQ